MPEQLPPLRCIAEAGHLHGRADTGIRMHPARVPEGLAMVETSPGGGAGQRQLPHAVRVIKLARRSLAAMGIDLYFLPPYSPELNLIESVFRQVKHQEIPQRSFAKRARIAGCRRVGLFQLRREPAIKSSQEITSGRSDPRVHLV